MMREPILPISIASLLLTTATLINAADLEAWIDTEVQDGMLRAAPKVRVQTPQTIRYELSAKRTGSAGSSSTSQSGTRVVACCDPVSLATLRLSVGTSDAYTLTLIVYVDNAVAAQVELKYPPEKDL